MNDTVEIFDWLLPLEEDEQFVGGLKKALGPENPIGGTVLFGETGDFEDTCKEHAS